MVKNVNEQDARVTTEVMSPLPHPSRQVCAVCKGPLTVHQEVRGGICQQPRCQKQRLAQWVTRREQEKAAALKRVAWDFRKRFVKTLGIAEPESLPLAIVPSFNERVVRLGRTRRAEFRAFLAKLIASATETGADVAAPSTIEVMGDSIGEFFPGVG